MSHKVKKQFLIMMILFLFAFILYPKEIQSETQDTMNIAGVVTDESNQALQGVKVYFGEELRAITNEKGEYSFWIYPGAQGTLTFEQEDKEISNISSQKINYETTNHIKVVTSFPSSSEANSRYENIMQQKLSQIITNAGKQYEYVGSVIGSNQVVLETEEKLAPITQASVKRIHISYADESMAENMVSELNKFRKKI